MFKGKYSLIVTIVLFSLVISSGVVLAVTEITIWSHFDGPDTCDLLNNSILAKFNEAHPDINAKFEQVAWGAAHEKYLTSIVTGNPADIIFYPTPVWGKEFWLLGGIEPLDKYVENWENKNEILDVGWKYSKFDGQIFGIPIMTMTQYLYYRADWFEELGMEPPKTREELLTAAKKITADLDGDGKTDRYGYTMRGTRGGMSTWESYVMPVLEKFDYKYVRDNGESTFRLPEAKEANQWFVELFTKHKVTQPTAPNDGYPETLQAFQSGLTGMFNHHITTSMMITENLGEKANAVVTPTVHGNRAANQAPHHFIITSASKNKEEAWKVLSWLTSPEQAIAFNLIRTGIPLIKNPEKYDPYFGENMYQKVSAEQLPDTYVPQYIETIGPVTESDWPENFQKALLGEITPDEMMDAISDVLEGN